MGKDLMEAGVRKELVERVMASFDFSSEEWDSLSEAIQDKIIEREFDAMLDDGNFPEQEFDAILDSQKDE